MKMRLFLPLKRQAMALIFIREHSLKKASVKVDAV